MLTDGKVLASKDGLREHLLTFWEPGKSEYPRGSRPKAKTIPRSTAEQPPADRAALSDALLDVTATTTDNQPRMPVTVRQVVRWLENDGWVLVAQRGSHMQFKHRDKPGRVTVAGKPKDDLHPKTLRSILYLAGIDNE